LYNRIATINLGVNLTGIRNLIELVLDSNKIEFVEESFFIGIPNLRTLSLNSNRIKSLIRVNFSGLPNLENLYLFNNYILLLGESTFFGLESLSNLVLQHNLFTSFENISFSGLDNLKSLYFVVNNDFLMEQVELRGLNQLESLRFRFRRLQLSSRIEMRNFDRLKQLEFVSSQIKNLRNITFVGIENQRIRLSFRDNYLEDLHSISINGLNGLYELDLTENRWEVINQPFSLGIKTNSTISSSSNIVNVEISGLNWKIINPIVEFPKNIRLTIFYSIAAQPIYKIFDQQLSDITATYSYYFPNTIIQNIENICASSHLFLKRQSKFVRAYQSIPFRFEDNDLLTLNCSFVFALFRKCFLIRYMIGVKSDYDAFIAECHQNEILDANIHL
jgi:hypothetical protein